MSLSPSPSTSTAKITMKPLCMFCFDEAQQSISNSKIKTEEYWPYIQPTEDSPPPQTPPMCPICSIKIEEITKCHREIKELEWKLDMVRKILDAAVEDVRETMRKGEQTNSNPTTSASEESEPAIVIVSSSSCAPPVSGAKRSFNQMMTPSTSTSGGITEEEARISSSKRSKVKTYASGSRISLPSTSKKTQAEIEAEARILFSEINSLTTDPFSSDAVFGELPGYHDHLEEISNDAPPSSSTSTKVSQAKVGEAMAVQNNLTSSKHMKLLVKQGKSVKIVKVRKSTLTPSQISKMTASSSALKIIGTPTMISNADRLTLAKTKAPEVIPSSVTSLPSSSQSIRRIRSPAIRNAMVKTKAPQVISTYSLSSSTSNPNTNEVDVIHLDSPNSEKDDDDEIEILHDPHQVHPPVTVEVPSNPVYLTTTFTAGLRSCMICGLKLPLPQLRRHMPTHVGNYFFQCPTCTVTFPSRLSYSYFRPEHRGRCKQVKPTFTCEINNCGKELRIRNAFKHFLEKHENRQKQKKNFPCPFPSCSEKFTWKQSLEFHLGSHEQYAKNLFKENVYTLKTPPENKIISRQCELCEESLELSASAFMEHMKGHVGDYAFQCKTCLVTFPSRLSSQYYSRAHRNGRRCWRRAGIPMNFNCEVERCGKVLNIKTAFSHLLEEHETSERKFPCPVTSCTEAFTWEQTLELHIGDHGKKNPDDSENETETIQQCEICGESLQLSLTAFKEHMISHVGQYAFQCPMGKCLLTFASRYSSECRTHRREGTKHLCYPQSMKCDECGEEFDQMFKLRSHLLKHENESPETKDHKCPIPDCGKEFTLRQSVEFHLCTHEFQTTLQRCNMCRESKTPDEMEAHLNEAHGVGAGEVTKCGYCPFRFHVQEELVEHLVKHLGNDNGIKCHLCLSKEVFQGAWKLRRHYFMEHQIGRQYLCEKCDHLSFSLRGLKSHRKKLHDGKRKTYTCDICKDKHVFLSLASMKTHNIKFHGGEKIKCKFCTASFNTTQSLEHHEKYEHRGVERKFPCTHPECDLVFNRKHALTNHLEIDHWKKEYKCHKCDKVAHTRFAFQRHVKRVHYTDILICDTCGKSVKGKESFQKHLASHSEERPFVCTLCGASFKDKTYLNIHSKNVHEKRKDKFKRRGVNKKNSKKKKTDQRANDDE